MTKTEKQIIDLIQNNKFLSDDLKKRYILALFMMDSAKQKDYLTLWGAFETRCQKVQHRDIKLTVQETQGVLRTVDEVKQDLIKKIKSSNQSQ
ncbi:hypothetical protein COY07_03925 [Candidatus Peregrinibacteria bacterium CG_4_10_14_0_2_um_filter_43_11]|nr:MAG: hypothetical protein COY07_03925 [Candidatus Peregrinibacteria bacterium CG_4_10_14_0_2_um_filter_43_11]